MRAFPFDVVFLVENFEEETVARERYFTDYIKAKMLKIQNHLDLYFTCASSLLEAESKKFITQTDTVFGQT